MTGTEDLKLYEVELFLRDSSALADSLFPVDKCHEVLNRLLVQLGFSDLKNRIDIQQIEDLNQPALAFRLCPPYDNILFDTRSGGFAYYRRLFMETGRILMWAYADSTLPYLLREYPQGSEEILTGLLEDIALDSAFLAENFEIKAADLNRFIKYDRWLRVFRIRQVLMHFYFDAYLSDGPSDSASEQYWALEGSLMLSQDSSFHWIESILTGTLSRYPEYLAHLVGRIKLKEILFKNYDKYWLSNPESGQFIIKNICRPGRSQTIEDIIGKHSQDKVSLQDIKRQYGLH